MSQSAVGSGQWAARGGDAPSLPSNADLPVPTRFRAVLFDLGDTLLDFEPMDTRALFRQAARATHDVLAGRGIVVPDFERYARVY